MINIRAMEKPKSIIVEEEIQGCIDLGLGRGVNSTNLSPWLNKSSYLVRKPTVNNIIGTDEGGFLQTYKSEIWSSADLQTQFKASVSVPYLPLSLGVEGEYSRSSFFKKIVVGKKVVNRTISFRMDHGYSYESSTAETIEDQDVTPVRVQTTFEDVLSDWIVKRIKDRGELKADEEGSSTELLSDYLLKASKEDSALISDDCADFIRFFGVTHFVSSVTLGAAELAIYTETQYSRAVKEGLNVSAATVTSTQERVLMKSNISKATSSSLTLGKIVDGRAERGSSYEVVVGIKLLPIHSLIHHNQFVYDTLKKALTNYIEEKTVKPTGPYLIQCGDEQMFWKVESDDLGYSLSITTDVKHASLFYVIPDEKSNDTFEFCIGWQGQILQQLLEDSQAETLPKIMRYLEVKTFLFGHSPGPLKLKSECSAAHTRLSLYKQLKDDYFEAPSDAAPWLKNKQVYFISSANHKSLITASRSPYQIGRQFYFKCMGAQKYHDEKTNWMLFRLLNMNDSALYAKAQQAETVSTFEVPVYETWPTEEPKEHEAKPNEEPREYETKPSEEPREYETKSIKEPEEYETKSSEEPEEYEMKLSEEPTNPFDT